MSVSQKNLPVIGFIGLGLMGSAMVRCLQSKGYALNVMAHKSRANVDAAIALGATERKTPKEIAENSDVVMLCVDTSVSVEANMLGDNGVIAGLKPDAVVIDFGTSQPDSTKKLAQQVAAVGAHMLDAPLGRTPAHAEQGLLNIMAAGEKSVFDRMKSVLDDLGENVFHVGGIGAGHTIKLLNNLLSMTTAACISEMFAMADQAGVSRQTLYDVISAGPNHSGIMDFVKSYALDGNRESLAFSIKNGGKDVGYYADMAKNAGFESYMSIGTHKAFQSAISDGRGENYVTELLDFFAK